MNAAPESSLRALSVELIVIPARNRLATVAEARLMTAASRTRGCSRSPSTPRVTGSRWRTTCTPSRARSSCAPCRRRTSEAGNVISSTSAVDVSIQAVSPVSSADSCAMAGVANKTNIPPSRERRAIQAPPHRCLALPPARTPSPAMSTSPCWDPARAHRQSNAVPIAANSETCPRSRPRSAILPISQAVTGGLPMS